MSKGQTQRLACPKCGNKQKTTVWYSINVTENPRLREQLFKATLNTFRCKKCGCVAFVRRPFFYQDETREFCVQFYPPEALQEGEIFHYFMRNGKVYLKDIIEKTPGASDAAHVCGYLGEPHVVFDIEEVQRYVFFREQLYQREGPEARIYRALQALLGRSTEDSWVLIEEPQSEKFVQFGIGRLGMDVPCSELTSEEADRASHFFSELGEKGPREYHARDLKTGKTRHGASFAHNFRKNARAAAKAAIAFFTKVYGFPADVELAVKEH